MSAFISNQCEPIVDDDGQPLRFYINANAAVRYRRDNDKPQNIVSVLRNVGTTEKTRTYLKQLGIRYDYPKPLALIEYLIKIGCEPLDGIVVDFFAGSGTTAEAVLNANRNDDGNRQFICVQLPEPSTDAGFANIASITMGRVRHIARSDEGFRAFALAESNVSPWLANTTEHDVEQQLELHVHHLRSDRSDDDLLFEILLKEGYPLTVYGEKVMIGPNNIYSLIDGAMLVCLDRALTLEGIREMAARAPSRVVCLDEGFAGNDQLKANAVQIFKSKNIVFRTV